MAAGLGTRMRPFTEHVPKALLPVMGVPVAQFALDAFATAVPEGAEVVANIHHLPEQAEEGLRRLTGPSKLIISDERDLLLGSGGGIRKALPHFKGEPFFLLNADTLCSLDLSDLARTHQRLRRQHGVTITLAVFENPPASGKYREIHYDPQSQLVTRLGEVVAGRPFFVGAAVIEPEALSAAPQSGAFEFVPEILAPEVARQRVGVHSGRGLWLDVGSPQLWLEAHVHLMKALETGVMGTVALPQLWRQRIEAHNRRVATSVWLHKHSPSPRKLSRWVGPAYWHPLADQTALPPQSFGPDAVLYGSAAGMSMPELKEGVGYGGLWTGVRPVSGTAQESAAPPRT